MDKKSATDKQRKSTVAFKRRRSQLNKHKISETSKKEAKEGTIYESDIGLNLNSTATAVDLNNSELSVTELYGINAAITKQHQEQYENAVPKYTSRPTVQKEKFDDSKFYHFVLFDIETNSTGKSAEVSASSLPWIGQTNNSRAMILPNRYIDSHASKVNKLTVKTVNGIRRLFKDNRPVEAFELSQALR